jgi:glycerol-3-phosphate acyltransferase PlsY
MNNFILEFFAAWNDHPSLIYSYGIYLFVAYLLGSIPFGLLFATLLKKNDLRTEGSGNVGATNALRTGGKLLGILTLLGDFFKGFLIVYFSPSFPDLLSESQNYMFLVAIAFMCVIGHVFSLFLKGKGGKGVATALGTIAVLNPYLFLIAIIIWGLTLYLSRISGLSAVITFISLPIIGFVWAGISYWVELYCVVLSVFIVYTHRKNIEVLLKGDPNFK